MHLSTLQWYLNTIHVFVNYAHTVKLYFLSVHFCCSRPWFPANISSFFKTSSIPFEDEFVRCLPNRSSRRLQNIFKKTSRRRLANTPWRRLQYVFTKTNVYWVGANWYKWKTRFINIKVIFIKILPNVTIFCF